MSELYLDDSDRYSRLRLISWWNQDKLRAAKVLVVGAGALGNEVLKNLALLGIGQVLVIDLDEIEDSNLTRSVLFRTSDRGKSKAVAAAKMLREINSDTQVVPIHGNVMTDIGLGVFRDVDVVIGCLDNREARLWVNRCCWKVGTPWVDGGIQEISGVAKVFVPPGSACYECAMTENDYRLISLRYSCPLLKREDLLAGKVPTAPTIASMIAGLQTQEALKLLHGLPVQAGAALVFNGVANNFYTTHYQRREDCLSHETYPEAVVLPFSAEKNTAKELFAAAKSHFTGDQPLTLELDRDLVLALHCNCGNTRSVMQPQQLVSANEALCPKCGETAQPEMIHSIEQTSPHAEQKLAALGIPAYDIVRITSGGEQKVFLLATDQSTAFPLTSNL
ncbi:HesA/MoeB/ThiF family protein [Anatilimnocola floriformis]|uniref:HesA/MoeB/ThiF family protein n=1 Tax=Anatilimnocola floriformis TaxID=2948575 RepID=UPI0020C365FF|nr:ThiF family adenylyltransferase [Anatilimnocola floriformis]